MPDWDDLRYALAVADAGSLAGAARLLRVDHTTVLRRIAGLERALNARLFERLPTGYALTPAGEELVAAARRVSETVTEVERRIAGEDLRLTGVLRLATSDTLMNTVLPEALAGFAAAHPSVTLELSTSTSMVNLTKREADVALRPARKIPENLVGRRIAQVAIALYAAPSYLQHSPPRKALSKHVWIGLDDSLSETSVAQWMARELKDVSIRTRTDTISAAARAAVAGLGVAALPCYLGDLTPRLRRLGKPIAAMSTDLWLVTHEDLQKTARVRAIMDWLSNVLTQERDLLEGGRPHRRKHAGS
ncbi:MAG TPA: LysR family transcriptional regulator [Polyangiaceae bacterium]|nr:LysR family transcriptional regulator [Polyangiaceae bacterium]